MEPNNLMDATKIEPDQIPVESEPSEDIQILKSGGTIGQPPVEEGSKFREKKTPPTSAEVHSAAVIYPPRPKFKEKQRNIKKPIKIIVLTCVFFVFLSLSSLLLVAYGKVSILSPDIRRKAESIVFKVPFIPKTPEYILMSSLEAHKEVTQMHVDVNFGLKSKGLQDTFGSSYLDVNLSSDADFSNELNPKGTIHIVSAAGFDMDMIFVDNIGYYKFNTIPSFMNEVFYTQNANFNPILNIWFFNEMTQNTNQESLKGKLVDKPYKEFAENIFVEEVLPDVVITNEFVGEDLTYRLHLDVTEEVLNKISNKVEKKEMKGISVSPSFKGTSIDAWIDQETYYLRKVSVSSDLNSVDVSNVPLAEDINDSIFMTFTLQTSKINESFVVQAPSSSISLEEFIEMFLEVLHNSYSDDLLESVPESTESIPEDVGSPFGEFVQ